MVAALLFPVLLGGFSAPAVQEDRPKLPQGPISIRTAIILDGKKAPLIPAGKSAAVLLFVNVDCPIANRYAPDIANLRRRFAKKGVEIFHVYSDSSLTKRAIQRHQKDFSLGGTAVWDKDLALAKAVGAQATPEAVVLDKDRRIRYRGRIDSGYQPHSKERIARPVRKDLELALTQLLAGKKIVLPSTEVVGCRLAGA